MENDNSHEVELTKKVKYEKIRNLVIAAYYAGQESGLKLKSFSNQDCIDERDRLIKLILTNLK